MKSWVAITNKTINPIENKSKDLKAILENYFGDGIWYFIDLNISEANGCILTKSEKETNKELDILSETLLTIK